MQNIPLLESVIWALLGFALGAVVFYVGKIKREARLQAENDLLKHQIDELKSTEALLRLEINEIGLSNTRLETLLEESGKLRSSQQGPLSREALQECLDERLAPLLTPLQEWLGQNNKMQEREKTRIKGDPAMSVERSDRRIRGKNRLSQPALDTPEKDRPERPENSGAEKARTSRSRKTIAPQQPDLATAEV